MTASNAALNRVGGPGTTILVKPGTYREQVTVPVSGASGSPLVIKALGTVIIDGADSFEQPALWAQQLPAAPEVAVQLRQPDVLEHADRADGVVRAVIDVAEIGVANLDAVAEPALRGAFARELGLWA